ARGIFQFPARLPGRLSSPGGLPWQPPAANKIANPTRNARPAMPVRSASRASHLSNVPSADAVRIVAVPRLSGWHADCRVLRRSLPTDTTLGRQAERRLGARYSQSLLSSRRLTGLPRERAKPRANTVL